MSTLAPAATAAPALPTTLEQEAEKRLLNDSARGPVLFGFIVFILFFGGFCGWAAFAPLASAVVTQGFIKVEGSRKTVQHLEGGIVREILTKDGDEVRAGQVLIRLDDIVARASMEVVSGMFDLARAQEGRLVAELANAPTMRIPADLLARYDSDALIKDLIDGQRNAFEARRNTLSGQTDVLKKRVDQLNEQIGGLNEQVRSYDSQIRLIDRELVGTKELNEKGFAPLTRVLALERARADLMGRRGEYLGNIARAQQQRGETEIQILQLQRDRVQQVTDDLNKVRAELARYNEQMNTARDALLRTEIKAPIDGIVVGMAAISPGGVINRSDRLLEIVPQIEKMVIEASIMPTDIDDVYVGQRTEIHLTAFKQRLLPIVHGNVTMVSADRLTDQRTGMAYYKIEAEIDAKELAEIPSVYMKPGMPADVLIPTGERTLLEYLINPLTLSMRRAMREE